jgi:hypothetical protein
VYLQYEAGAILHDRKAYYNRTARYCLRYIVHCKIEELIYIAGLMRDIHSVWYYKLYGTCNTIYDICINIHRAAVKQANTGTAVPCEHTSEYNVHF